MFIQTKVDILARLITCASTDPTRPHIHGVHVRPCRIGGVLIEATNGHILALEHDPDGRIDANKQVQRIVAPWAIKAIVAASKALAKVWKVAETDMRVTVSESSYQLHCGDAKAAETSFPPPNVNPFMGFDFPDVDRVIPRIPFDGKPVQDCYNAKLLATLAASARTVKRDAAVAYELYAYDIGSPARVRVAGAERWLGVIMPMRGTGEGPRAVWEAEDVAAPAMQAAA